jgi:hypothetical protein
MNFILKLFFITNILVGIFAVYANQEPLPRCRFIATLVDSSEVDESKNKFHNLPGTRPESVEVGGIPMIYFDYEFDHMHNSILKDFPIYSAKLTKPKEVCINFTDIPQSFDITRCKQKAKKNYSLSISMFSELPVCDEDKKNTLGRYIFFKALTRSNKGFMVAYAPPSSFYVKITHEESSQRQNNAIVSSDLLSSLACNNDIQSSAASDKNFSFSLPSYILGFVSCGIFIGLILYFRTNSR